jgi:hypothetical protein
MRILDPRNELQAEPKSPAPRLSTLKDAHILLLDISKPGGDVFLERLETLLKEAGVGRVTRERKPTFAKPAPDEVLTRIKATRPQAVIEALAD